MKRDLLNMAFTILVCVCFGLCSLSCKKPIKRTKNVITGQGRNAVNQQAMPEIEYSPLPGCWSVHYVYDERTNICFMYFIGQTGPWKDFELVPCDKLRTLYPKEIEIIPAQPAENPKQPATSSP